MTTQDDLNRAREGLRIAREGLREAAARRDADLVLDHWAARVIFWKDELRRLQRFAFIAPLEG